MKLEELLFIDIETVGYRDELTPELAKEAERKEIVDGFALHAEFGRVAAVGIGEMDGMNLKVGCWCDLDEKRTLHNLREHLASRPNAVLCGHNIKSFDIPFLARRMIMNGVPLPEQLKIAGKKPWEVKHLDTMELWQFGDRRHSVSLHLLCLSLGVESPKKDITGVGVQACWKEERYKEIEEYCAGDVVATARCLLKIAQAGESMPVIHIQLPRYSQT